MTPNQFKSKFKSNSNAKKALADYYSAFTAAASKQVPLGTYRKFGMSLGSAGWVTNSAEMIKASKRFAQLTTKLLGPRHGDETHLRNLIQTTAHDSLAKEQCGSNYQQAVIAAISDTLDQDFEVYYPNYLFSLYPRITPLKIGSVRVLKLAQLDTEI